MNYDAAYELQKAMRDSEEHKTLMLAQAAAETDETTKKLVQDVIQTQMQYEYAKMADAPEAEQFVEKLKELDPLVQANPKARNFFEAYARWNQIANDIYRIISEPITEGMKILEGAK